MNKKIYIIYKRGFFENVAGVTVDTTFNILVEAYFDEEKARKRMTEINDYDYCMKEVKIMDTDTI